MAAFQLEPAANGAYDQWPLVGTGTTLAAVQTAGDGNVIRGTTNGYRSTFTLTDLPSEAQAIFGSVIHYARMNQTAGGAETVYATLRHGSTNSDVLQNLPADSTYHDYNTPYADCPGSSGWTVAQVNALETGEYVQVAPATALYCDRLYVTGSYVAPGGFMRLMLGVAPWIGPALALYEMVRISAFMRTHRQPDGGARVWLRQDELAEAFRQYQAWRRPVFVF